MEDYQLVLPIRVDKKPNGKMVRCAEMGEPGYAENVECTIQIQFNGEVMFLSYYCEDDTVLNEHQFKQVVKMNNK